MASKKVALGRGLSALLPTGQQESDAPVDASGSETPPSKLYRFEDRVRLLGRVADLEIEQISPNPYQPRQDFNDEALDELAASIQQLGIIQPITVRAQGGGRFEVISGERRLRAARRAGLRRVPAYVREADTEEMLEMALVENVQREELNPVEVALGYQRLMDECGLTQEQVAERVGKNRTTVANFLRLLKLPPQVQAALRDGSVSVGHARSLINVTDEELQATLLDEIRHNDLSVREIEERVRAWRTRTQIQQPSSPEEASSLEPVALPDRDALQLKAFTKQLRFHFNTQIQIKHKADGSGKIELSYYSEEDLERLMELLAKQ
jgi:ParB family chromosome partitioning protein